MQAIMERIMADAKRKAKAIEQACEKEVEEIKAKALAEAERIRSEIISNAEKEAAIEEKRFVSRAVLSAKKERMALIDKKLGEIIHDINLPDLRKEKAYEKKLRKMLLEAIKSMPSEDIVVECGAESFEIVKNAISFARAKITKSQHIGTGAVVRSVDGNILIDCTFEALLELKIPEIKKAMVMELGD